MPAARSIAVHAVLLAVFGVLIPWRRGLDFLDPVMMGAYSCLGVLFAAPSAAEFFGRSRPTSMRDAATRLGKAVGYGEAVSLALIVAGIVTVSAIQGSPQFPLLDDLAKTLLLGLALSTVLAVFAAWRTLNVSAPSARSSVRLVLLALAGVFFFFSARLADVALPVSGLCALIAAVMFPLLRREVNPK